MSRKTAAVITLGCRLNQADSALISSRLQRMGFEIVSPDASPGPGLIFVNSCAVTATAMKKSLQTLRSVRAENPQAYLVFTGCGAVTDQNALENRSDIDLLLSNEDKKNLEQILPRYLSCLDIPDRPKAEKPKKPGIFLESAHTVFPFRTRAILKVQDGCSNACSYCIVPKARGPQRSRDFNETLEDFKDLVNQGFREIVLSGVNLCCYRCGGRDLADLIRAFLEVPGSWRLRLGSAEPGPALPRLLECMAEAGDRMCRYLHMPIQNGSDTVLKAMNRHCLTGEFADFVRQARELMPGIHIGTDIIIGFPGETNALFEESVSFIREMNFANIHAFPFSPRPGTPAAALPSGISKEQLAARVETMKKIKAESAAAYMKAQCGQEETVLVEVNRGKDIWEGWSGNYLRTLLVSSGDLQRELVKVRFKGMHASGEMEALPL